VTAGEGVRVGWVEGHVGSGVGLLCRSDT
jgi:hypothetical protein